ncbi:MAG TPA: hypothetical protein VFQ96_06340 [Microbacteriaceae bacterium]|nr:hypothetical protein [Microbacteriaceae bacterium]
MRHLKRNIAAFGAAAAIVASVGFVGVQSAVAEPAVSSASAAVSLSQAPSATSSKVVTPAVAVQAAAPDSTSGNLNIGSPTPGGYVTSKAWVAVGAGIFLLLVWSVSIFGYRRFH